MKMPAGAAADSAAVSRNRGTPQKAFQDAEELPETPVLYKQLIFYYFILLSEQGSSAHSPRKRPFSR